MADAAVPRSSVEGIVVAEREGYWEARLRPTHSFPHVMEQMEEVQAFCADRKPARLVVDLRGFLGSVTLTDRYELGSFATRLQGLVGRLAAIARPEFIDPQKFGARVAQNRGLNADVFDSSDAALAWLLKS
jgi:hypothetical protein